MEVRDSWDRAVPLAAPVLADAETDAPVAYYDGVRAVVAIAAQFTSASWNLPTTCPEWRAADLAGHLRCVVEDYHEYLDDAPVSRLSRLMATGANPQSIARKLARQNAAEIATLPDVEPQEHIAAFARSATRYAARIGPLLHAAAPQLPRPRDHGGGDGGRGVRGMARARVGPGQRARHQLPARRPRGRAGGLAGRDPAAAAARRTRSVAGGACASSGRLPA